MKKKQCLVRLFGALAITSFLFIAAALDVHAQDLEPRAYSNTPVGLNFLIAGYGYTEGDVLPDSSLPIEDAEANIHSALIAYVRSLDIWGRSGKVQIVLPYVWLDASGKLAGDAKEREVDGFADPRFRLTVNLYGAPALLLDEFADYHQDTIVGVSLLVTAPYGHYDSDKLANIGTNRWSFKPELGISKALGRWTLELSTAVKFYTDNDDFFGGQTQEQDPIYSVQGHVIYHFLRGMWGAADVTYYTGGRTTIDGVEKEDLQDNWRFGLTLAVPVDRHNSIKLYGSTGVFTRAGTDFNAVGVAWQYRWGGGL